MKDEKATHTRRAVAQVTVTKDNVGAGEGRGPEIGTNAESCPRAEYSLSAGIEQNPY